MSCRYRKVRCDGAQPTCGQCQHIPNGEEDCEYRDALGTKTNIELLEDNIARLETKIRQLESQDDPPPDDAILLSMPYTTSQARQTTSLTAPTSEDRVNWSALITTIFEFPPQLRRKLHPPFLFSSYREIQRNRNQFTLTDHTLLGPRNTQRSLSLGVHAYLHMDLPHLEMYFLHKTLNGSIRRSAVQIKKGRSTLQAIQVQVLLSLYYMDAGKMLRAGYYASTALSLANSSNLSCLGTSPALSQDPIERFERVQAFWTCLVLSAHFISHGPTALKCPSKNLGSVTTPWPTELVNDSAVQFKDEAVIQMYMDGQPDSASSPKAQLAKNSIFTTINPSVSAAVQVNCTQVQALETLISRAISLLPDCNCYCQ
ncbi:hypothetical protein DL96DRAFT_1706019 [Flagelloscypha sp. PMI_526]|nr:hypothetical protein DL96DRAFT_1706019 [Flagelloscypha sp. PMI_526]